MTLPADYPHHLPIPTRWADNDIYGHVNNVEYYAFFDTVINAYLIHAGGLDILGGDAIGLCAESHCAFREAITFPEVVDAGLRVAQAGDLERALRDRAVPRGRRAGRRHGLVRPRVRRSHDAPPGADPAGDPGRAGGALAPAGAGSEVRG